MNCFKPARTFWIAAIAGMGLLMPSAALANKKLIRLLFDGPISEAPMPMELNLFSFGGDKAKTLRDWVSTIDKAAKDGEINGAVMLIEDPAVGFAQLEELSRALKRFRATGKKIHCYIDHASNASYALASNADHITLAEYSSLDITGLNAQMMFYKGTFDKIGIEADMMHCGDYKTALEPFTRTEPSKENAEMTNWLLDGIYNNWIALMAENRKLTPEQMKAAVDAAPIESKPALEKKLVDAVAGYPVFKQMIHKEYGQDVAIEVNYGADEDGLKLDMNNPFALFQKLGEMFGEISEGEGQGKPGVALVYIDGMITTGKSEPSSPFGGGGNAGSTTIRAAFEEARDNPNVKIVVVRVDSPGGSALGSDIMWDAARRCAAEKPVIVSMGNVAGSGGYYVAIPGDMIFAESTTLTGSIGVVGGKMVLKGVMDWAGLSITEFSRGKHAALMSPNHKWNDEERKTMMAYLDSVYGQFKGRIMECRGKKIKGDLEKLAGGRVYTGAQALDIGLIDKIGGLTDAMKFASDKAGLGSDYEVYVLPKPKGLAEVFKTIFGGEEQDDEWKISSPGVATGLTARSAGLGALLADPVLARVAPVLEQLAPQQLRMALRGLMKAAIMNDEHVGMFMPFELNIR